jgi:hypothetical protein
MPSDDRTRPPNRLPQLHPAPGDPLPEPARAALARAGEGFRSSLVAALEETGDLLSSLRSSRNGRTERTSLELGAFAEGAMDPVRFARLLSPGQAWDAERLQRFEQARALLEETAATLPGLVEILPWEGIGLREAVDRALAEAGRAFGAVRTLALLRTGAYSAETHGKLLDGIPFAEWRGVERSLARPLLVWVRGSALLGVAALDEFLDGGQKIVLVVAGPCPPAPLARLLAPGIAVIQTADPAELEWLAGVPGPAVGALVPEEAAHFRWDPRGGGDGGGALELRKLPESLPNAWLGGISPERQAADLRLLELWERATAGADRGAEGLGAASGAPEASAEAPSPSPSGDPAERLAAWLLSQADLDRPG